MNALTKIENTSLHAMTEGELVSVLQSSLYPGAKLESIKMVLGYCKAAGLDPMQKPVHIVPMSVSTGQKDEKGWDIKAMRDVIMPGVGLYRTQAARTGLYAGVSDPEFGPTRTLNFSADRWEDEGGRRVKRTTQETVDYPEWCRVSVTRIVDGTPREFSAREYWQENYATKSTSTAEPNAMWKRRPFGQLAKCAEAQALRKAFPEMTGAQPTAEEMEGQHEERNMGPADVVGAPPPAPAAPAAPPAAPPALPVWPAEKFAEQFLRWQKAVDAGMKTAADILALATSKGVLTPEQKAQIEAMGKPAAPAAAEIVMTYAQVAERLNKAADLDRLAEAESLIQTVPDEGQRKELSDLYDKRCDELNA